MTEKHYVLFYEAGADYVERRVPFRDAHLSLAREAHARGELVLAGALADPVDGSVLIFKGETDAAARAFVQADPYIRNGLIKNWRVREWTVSIGGDALTKV